MGVVIWKMLWTCFRCGQTEFIETQRQTELPPGWAWRFGKGEEPVCPACKERSDETSKHDHDGGFSLKDAW